MTIRPVDLNGMIQRTQDIGNIKQQQDVKPLVDQQNIQIEVKKEEFRQSEQVQKKDDTGKEESRYDAKEEGKGQYQQHKGKKRKHQSEEEGKVVIKGRPQGFDVKI